MAEDAVDIKNGFHHIKIHSLYLSTVQRSYLLTLITKAIDTWKKYRYRIENRLITIRFSFLYIVNIYFYISCGQKL